MTTNMMNKIAPKKSRQDRFKILWPLVAIGIGLSSYPANAQWCIDERVIQVILSDNEVYFTTDKSCPDWCMAKSSLNDDQKSRQYSLFLTALSKGTAIMMEWPSASSSCEALPRYSVPSHILIR